MERHFKDRYRWWLDEFLFRRTGFKRWRNAVIFQFSVHTYNHIVSIISRMRSNLFDTGGSTPSYFPSVWSDSENLYFSVFGLPRFWLVGLMYSTSLCTYVLMYLCTTYVPSSPPAFYAIYCSLLILHTIYSLFFFLLFYFKSLSSSSFIILLPLI